MTSEHENLSFSTLLLSFLNMERSSIISYDAGYRFNQKLWSELPRELVFKIFSKFPFTYLFSLSFLSQEWTARIRSLEFRNEVTEDVGSKWESYSPLICSDSSAGMELVGYCRASQKWQSFSLSHLLGNLGEDTVGNVDRWEVVGAAGALLCLRKFCVRDSELIFAHVIRDTVVVGNVIEIVVINPLLKLQKVLPLLGLGTQVSYYSQVCHFLSYYDSDGNPRYKLISISQDDFLELGKSFQVHVYDSATETWTVAGEPSPGIGFFVIHFNSVYIDETIYISLERGYVHETMQRDYVVLMFSFATGTWKYISLHNQLRGMPYDIAQIVVCGSSAFLVLWEPEVDLGQYVHHNHMLDGMIFIYKINEDFSLTFVANGPDGCKKVDSVEGVVDDENCEGCMYLERTEQVKFVADEDCIYIQDELSRAADFVEGITADEECIYLQVYGKPVLASFHVQEERWSIVPLLHDTVLDENASPSVPLMFNGVHRELKQCSHSNFVDYIGDQFRWTQHFFQPGKNTFVRP